MDEPRIVILDPEVVNQIAAGEVVERPASVVKELVENALDAGARRIDVEVEQGGQRLVRVADDGCGMTPREAQLSLERHATSKLRRTEDLLGITSMGFRGEALPSIASVSQLTLRTRTADGEVGCVLRSRGGTLDPPEPVGCRPGTTVEVAELFFNTPARLKFLKSTATETAHITDTLVHLALANPDVHLTLALDGRGTLDLPAGRSRLERARRVLGRRAERLFSASGGGAPGVAVEACLTPPEQSTRAARSVHLLVNRRVVRDRALVHAVVAGYEALLERGRFPLAVVYLDLDPQLVDVNVHPQKVEVRFADPGEVFAAIRRCVRDAVAQGAWATEAGGRAYRLQGTAGSAGDGYSEHRARLAEATRRLWSTVGAQEDRATYSPTAAPEEPEGYFSGLRYVGQVLGTYLVLEGEEELVLIDQHAAHERVTFERLRGALGEHGALPAQRLLIPQQIELDAQLAAAAQEHADALERLGFELEPFGGAAWTVRAVPALLAGSQPEGLVREVIEALASGGRAGGTTVALEPLLARMACHASVRAGRALELDEIGALLSAMDRVDFSIACPHGRPVMVQLSRAELAGRFGR